MYIAHYILSVQTWHIHHYWSTVHLLLHVCSNLHTTLFLIKLLSPQMVVNGGYVIKVTMRSFQTFELTTETSTSVPQPGAEQNSTFETEQPENWTRSYVSKFRASTRALTGNSRVSHGQQLHTKVVLLPSLELNCMHSRERTDSWLQIANKTPELDAMAAGSWWRSSEGNAQLLIGWTTRCLAFF